jgi:Ca2+-binding RTX toxin-like protein
MANPILTELGFDQQLIDLINQERAKSGAKPLTSNDQLDEASDKHALDMATNNNLSETGSDGSTPESRIKKEGFLSANVGETIANGADANEVFNTWLKDPNQSKKILNPTFEESGVGTVSSKDGKLFWAETYGGPDVAPPKPGMPPANKPPKAPNQVLNGTAGDDTLNGGNGRDTLNGGAGNDTLTGGKGRDILKGDAGNDILTGGNGRDILRGGAGNDVLTGGAGKDRFSFRGDKLAGQSITAVLGTDTIADFTAGDKIVLGKDIFRALKCDTGTLNKSNFATVADDSLVAATKGAEIVYSKGSGSLFYNANGKAAGLGNEGGSFATVTGLPNLTANDFTVVG